MSFQKQKEKKNTSVDQTHSNYDLCATTAAKEIEILF